MKYLCKKGDHEDIDKAYEDLMSFNDHAGQEIEFLKEREKNLLKSRQEKWKELEKALIKNGYIKNHKVALNINDKCHQIFLKDEDDEPLGLMDKLRRMFDD